MPKILILSRYDRKGASSRLRTFQYYEHLVHAGFEVEAQAFFNDDYLDAIYAHKTYRFSILGFYTKRIRRMMASREVDVIFLEKEALPWLPWQLERLFLRSDVPVVSDYDDAVFHRYDHHQNRVVRRLLGNKIDRVMANSAAVLVGNDYLIQRAAASGANRVEFVPTVVDLNAYRVRKSMGGSNGGSVGWIGTPSTWSEYMEPMHGLLSTLAVEQNATIVAVGARPKAASDGPFRYLPWSEDDEVELIHGMDIGIMPLTDTPWAQGKCGYKLIQYMACGLPVVASPVGVNRQIVEHGVNGFFASSEAEWREALATLIANSDLRRKLGAAGRKKIEQEYSLQVWGPRVAGMLRDIALRHGRR